MITCPECGAETRVIETRETPSGAYQRRRRACVSIACNRRLSTVEMIVELPHGIDPVLIDRADLERVFKLIADPLVAKIGLQNVISAIGGTHVEKQSSDEEIQRGASVEDPQPVRKPINGKRSDKNG